MAALGVRVFGIGVGLFLIFLLWTVALFACLVFCRSKGGLAYVGLASCLGALIVTLTLCFIPKLPETPAPLTENKVYDTYFIGRVCLVVVMGIFAIVGIVLYLVMHCSVPIYVKPLKQIKN